MYDRLTFDFEVSDISPVIKGTWVTVSHIVSLIVDGWTWDEILRSHPELARQDVEEAVQYAMNEDQSNGNYEAIEICLSDRGSQSRGTNEERGRSHYIFCRSDSPRFASFAYYPEADETKVILVPIGITLAPDSNNGVVLVNTYGKKVSATVALSWAEEELFGFKLAKGQLGVSL